jgi:hypothetical protein
MKIAFIGGTGEEGMGLAYRFALAGHECIIGSRALDKAEGAVAELREKEAAHGARLPLRAATNADAAADGEIVIVTTPYTAQAPTLPALAAELAGKIVVSTVVPMAFEAGRASLVAVPEGSAAQQEQALLRESTIVSRRRCLRGRRRRAQGDHAPCGVDRRRPRRRRRRARQLANGRGHHRVAGEHQPRLQDAGGGQDRRDLAE